MQFKYLSPKGHSSIFKVAAFQVLICLHTYATLYRSALSFGVFMLKLQRKPLPWLFLSLIWEGGCGEGSEGFSFFFLTKTGQRTFCVRTRERGLGNREGGRAAGTGKSFVQVPEPNTWIQMEKRAGGALYVGVSRTKWQELVLLWLHGDLEKCIIVSIHKKSSGISLILCYLLSCKRGTRDFWELYCVSS